MRKSEYKKLRSFEVQADILRARIAELEDHRLEHFRDWRNIETLCTKCSGTGVRAYGSTAGWSGGIGGQMMTSGVCDHCWGSGDEHEHGADLRKIRGLQRAKDRRIAELETAQQQRPVKCAAVKVGDDIHTGKNHGEIIQRVVNEFGESKVFQEQQGFIDFDSKFMTRAEAYESAVYHGQIEDDSGIRALLSEMLPYYFRDVEKSLRKENERLKRRIAELETEITSKPPQLRECCVGCELLGRIAELKAAQQWHDASKPPENTIKNIMLLMEISSTDTRRYWRIGYWISRNDSFGACIGWRDLPPMPEKGTEG